MDEQTKLSISEGHIREWAYEIYIERGGADGRSLGDWLQAESELEKTHGEEASRRKKK